MLTDGKHCSSHNNWWHYRFVINCHFISKEHLHSYLPLCESFLQQPLLMPFEVRTLNRRSPASYWNQEKGNCWGTHFVTKKQKNTPVICMSLCSTYIEIYSSTLLTLYFLYYEFMYFCIPSQGRESKKSEENWQKQKKNPHGLHIVLQVSTLCFSTPLL